ncbi:MAG TPA: short-chain dehydrogenase [Acidimicrobiaceae bacterium]|nr:short-chain dehydrogenase [Acidimicrobiaceae bacterium]
MDLGISGKTAAVAGGSAGLGLASATALINAGVRVAICGRNEARLAAAAASLGPLAVPILADVSTVPGATEFVEEAIKLLGPIEILVANAGGPPSGNYASTPIEAYGPALELNLLSTVAMCMAATPAMVESGWGRIVAITSMSVRMPIPQLILSNTARAGLTGFLKTLATEIAHHGITVNSVQPGLHQTDRVTQLHPGDTSQLASQIPTGVLGQPSDFGSVVAFLCSQQARFITGAALPIDGGQCSGLQ